MTRYQSNFSQQSAFRSEFLNGDTDAFTKNIEQIMSDGQSLKQGN